MNNNFRKEINRYIDEGKKEFNDNFDNIAKIKSLMDKNKGYITSKQIDENKIGRDYLKKMVASKDIIKVDRSVYIDSGIIEDPFYTFQLRYPNTIFSHFTALSFYNMTELISYTYDITCINNVYFNIFKKHNIFYVKKEWYNMGVNEITDNYGYKIKVYDLERCICDIIRSQKRLDIEQVKKSVRAYISREDKNLINLSKYSKKMGIHKEVMRFINMYED
jgi:hypothetical protein